MKPSRAICRPGREPLVSRSRAQTLVLFAMLLPALVGAAAITVDLALIMRTHAQLRDIAASAARAGADQVSSLALAIDDDFALVPDGQAEHSAQRVCEAYRQDAIADLECQVNVSFAPLIVAPGGPAVEAAWIQFLRQEHPLGRPGLTVHGTVTVRAQHLQRLYFLAPVTRQPTLELQATQTAVLVTGP